MNVWSVTPQAPLILPGNPALSDDDTTTGSSTIRRVSVALAAIAVVGGITVALTREPAAREVLVAAAPTSETETADSASAMSSGVVATEEELARARAARDSATADSARAAKRALALLPSAPSATPIPSTTPMTPAPRSAIASSVAPRPASSTTSRVVASPVAAAPVAAAPMVTSRNTPIKPAPTTPKVAAPIVAARTTPVVTTPAKDAAASPELRMAPLVSSVLRAGDNLRLHGSVLDRTTGRELSAPIRFSSSNPRLARVDGRTGTVRGVAPGRVRITADAGSAGRMAVNLSIVPRGRPVAIAPALPRVIVRPTAPVTTAAKPVSATTAPERPAPAAVAPTTTKPAINAPVTSTATAPTVVEPSPPRDVQRPDTNDVRVAADRFVGDVKSGLRRNEALKQFFGDGADHRAALLGAPSAVSETATGVRATFDMRLSKFDAAGRPLTRIVPVTIDIVKREGALNTSAVTIGALRKP